LDQPADAAQSAIRRKTLPAIKVAAAARFQKECAAAGIMIFAFVRR